MTPPSTMRSAPFVLAVASLALVLASHVAMQRRLTSIEASLRIALEDQEARGDEVMTSIRERTTHPGVDLTALLAMCRAEATNSRVAADDAIADETANPSIEQTPESDAVADARVSADALLENALATGRMTSESSETMRMLLSRLPGEDVSRIRVTLADAMNRGQIVPDDITSL